MRKLPAEINTIAGHSSQALPLLRGRDEQCVAQGFYSIV
ncbi:MAG: hypothetical protein ACI81O_000191 [Cyclobacteriaceae bacterium]|jgi:hypothetical protein